MAKNSEVLLESPVGTKFYILEADGTHPDSYVEHTEKGYQFHDEDGSAGADFSAAIAPHVFDDYFPEGILLPVVAEN